MCVLTVKTLTSLLPRTSSTRPSGLPVGTGMVPRMVQEEPSKVRLTAPTNDWLKSSILPISSMTNTLPPPPPSADPTCKRKARPRVSECPMRGAGYGADQFYCRKMHIFVMKSETAFGCRTQRVISSDYRDASSGMKVE